MTLNLRDRIRVILILLLVLEDPPVLGKLQRIKPGCRYEGRRYQEGLPVPTTEPCLQCRCTEGALRCRLRVCPRLPNPPPAGCRIRPPEENICCANLVCDDESHDAENMLRRAGVENEKSTNSEDSHSRLEGCVHEGVRYGPGSAMMGSRRCEYCYCIKGARQCIRPKCLLPLPGCTALYTPHSCCPVAYNCTREVQSSTVPPITGNGCRIGDRVYEEGEMARDILWKATCDNCFCAMGEIRCVPLACAPPLRGCSPIVREGQCCPSTYNCSGSIEVKATQNYASYAFISKDYAKFRKETNFFPAAELTTDLPVEGRGHRVVEENPDVGTTDLTGPQTSTDDVDVSEPTGMPSIDSEISANEIPSEADVRVKSTTTAVTWPTTTFVAIDQTNAETTMEDSSTETTRDSMDASATVSGETTVTTLDDSFTVDDSASSTDPAATWVSTLANEWEEKAEGEKSSRAPGSDWSISPPVDHRESQEKTSNCQSQKQKVPEDLKVSTMVTEAMAKGSISGPSSTVLMPDNILVMNVTVKTNVSVGHIQGVTINPIRSIPPDVEAILNITHREKTDEYDYDYSEPTLPPSLPNVRVIPFVAADALDKNKDLPSKVTGYSANSVMVSPELRLSENSGYYDMGSQENRFSPPVETEGGFVPREPPYFNPSYHSTNLNLEIGTGVTVVPASITHPHRKTDDLGSNCLYESREYRHGEMLPSTGICIICMCYYGEVVCSSEKCPLLKISCRRINAEQECCGKIICDEDESPTVVLDRADATAPSQHQPIVSPDPFRDVIKTEPAPDLPSLIEDMIPYLVERGITTTRPTAPMTTAPLGSPVQSQGQSHKTHLQNYDFLEKVPSIRPPPFDYREDNQNSLLHLKDKQPSNALQGHGEESDLIYKDPDRTLGEKLQEMKLSREKTTLIRINHTTVRAKQETSSKAGTTPAMNLLVVNNNESNSSTTKFEDQFPTRTPDSAMASSAAEHLHEEDSIFSLDSVFDLFFTDSGTTTTATPTPITSTEMSLELKVTQGVEKTSERTKTTKFPESSTNFGLAEDNQVQGSSPAGQVEATTPESKSKILPTTTTTMTSVSSLLKLAGCNIYGRMYRVGRIITELSGPCLECRCTEVGVQCKQLEC